MQIAQLTHPVLFWLLLSFFGGGVQPGWVLEYFGEVWTKRTHPPHQTRFFRFGSWKVLFFCWFFCGGLSKFSFIFSGMLFVWIVVLLLFLQNQDTNPNCSCFWFMFLVEHLSKISLQILLCFFFSSFSIFHLWVFLFYKPFEKTSLHFVYSHIFLVFFFFSFLVRTPVS